LRSVATAQVAKLDWPKKCEWTAWPSRDRAVVPSGQLPPKFRAQKSSQYVGRPVRHVGQAPHESTLIPTRSPGATFATFAPTRSTTPRPS
jgi:hypothetical protein